MTTSNNVTTAGPDLPDSTRAWNIFAIRGYATIVARKHNLAVPVLELESLSDEEILVRLQLVRDLAHLPPG
jgi:hypothetical protein